MLRNLSKICIKVRSKLVYSFVQDFAGYFFPVNGTSLVTKNVVALLFTLGLAMPWILAHNLSFYIGRFRFIGSVEFDQVTARESQGSATGDGLADALDVGMF